MNRKQKRQRNKTKLGMVGFRQNKKPIGIAIDLSKPNISWANLDYSPLAIFPIFINGLISKSPYIRPKIQIFPMRTTRTEIKQLLKRIGK